MISLITDNQSRIAALCREFGIHKLEVYGSATTDRFRSGVSDIDFIVNLGEYEPGVARRFLRFADALEALLDSRVDLITPEQIKNPYFRYAVDQQRVTIHEAGSREAAA
ncbi:MAG: nucleotidyltransferase domain-containing protein [Gemmatimonadetes bacterium]|nr:nucleotidyltransferase domain-containing protein [Gemmatimonadota bacterium]